MIPKVTFDQNVLRLQASDAEAVRFENILLHDSGRSSWFAVALAGTRSGADRKAAAFGKLPEVADVETISNYIPDHQAEKRAILRGLQRALAPIAIPTAARPNDPAALRRELGGFAARLAAMAALDRGGATAKTRALADRAIARLATNPHAFDGYERELAVDLGEQITLLKDQLAPAAVTEQNLPRIIRDRFIGASGLYLVQVYPKGDISVTSARPSSR